MRHWDRPAAHRRTERGTRPAPDGAHIEVSPQMSTSLSRTAFRIVAVAEALSWLGLLIGMLFKYVISDTEVGVKVFGPIHGAIFVTYVLTCLVVRGPLRWSGSTLLLALAASIPPFGSLVFEQWASRTGRLGRPAAAPVAGDERLARR
jgi:integral membrane protein